MIRKGDIVLIKSTGETGQVLRVNVKTCRLLVGTTKKSVFKTDLVKVF